MLIGLDETYKRMGEHNQKGHPCCFHEASTKFEKKFSVQVLEPYHKLKTSSFA